MKKYLLLLLLVAAANFSNATPAIHPAKTDSVYICVSNTGHKYHKYVCRGLARCTQEIRKVTKAQAIRMGYTACKICY